MVRAVCGVARFIVEPYGRFRALISTERHHVAISRAELANVVSVLLARAADSISKEPGDESTVWISTRANGDSLLLRVVDTGDGPRWPSAEQDDLVHRVRRAGGDVMLDRELGRGTTARVFLPLLDDC